MLRRVVLDWDEPVSGNISLSWKMLVASSSTLESLVMGNVQFQNKTVEQMARALRANKILTEIGFCSCQLQNQAGAVLGWMLQITTH